MNELTVFSNDLIPVYATGNGKKVIYGRDLHAALEVTEPYLDWIKWAITRGAFTKNKNFFLTGFGVSLDHIMSLRMAGEIAKFRPTSKGLAIIGKLTSILDAEQENTSLTILNFKGNTVRTVVIDGAPWFVARDVAEILGYSNPRDALAKHVKAEDKRILKDLTPAKISQIDYRSMMITAHGFQCLALRSKLSKAQEVEDWLTQEVLPSLGTKVPDIKAVEPFKPYIFRGQKVRTVVIDGVPWFVGKDVAEILGYSDTKDAIKTHVAEKDKSVVMGRENAAPLRRTENDLIYGTILINESGLYALILGSKLPAAQEFKHWITSEVIPSIRKTGSYSMNQKDLIEQSVIDPDKRLDLVIEFATKLKEEKQKTRLLEAHNLELAFQVDEMKPKAASFDKFIATGQSTNFRTSAALLGFGQNDFMKRLESSGYIYRDKHKKARPYALYINKGWFEMKAVECSDGTYRDQPYITPVGLSALRKKLEEKAND